MVENSDIEAKLQELNDAEKILTEKLNTIRKAKESLNLICVVEQKELTGYKDAEETIPIYKTNVFKKIDPVTLNEITEERRDEGWNSVLEKTTDILK